MPTPTGYEIQCRGSCSGDFVPLLKKGNARGRFYYVHPRPRGCTHHEDFDIDVTEIEDLRELHDVNLRAIEPIGREPIGREPVEVVPIEPDPIEPDPVEQEPVEPVQSKTKEEGEEDGTGIGFF